MPFQDFTDFPVWKKGFSLLLDVYRITKGFPKDERFLLISDMRRAANSVIHNVAEGFGRFEPKDKSRFYKISRGSSYELISQSLTGSALIYWNEIDTALLTMGYRDIIEELDKLIKSVESRSKG